ncbi:MAG: hypothetical protein IVW54_15050 [Candidatus Binataceae bacterium]|nr:hypothetical protein [Candidatus Binataceae bacterium]
MIGISFAEGFVWMAAFIALAACNWWVSALRPGTSSQRLKTLLRARAANSSRRSDRILRTWAASRP